MSKFIEALESRQLASVTPVNIDTQTHLMTDDAVLDYSYHAHGFEASNGTSLVGFLSIQSSQASDGSTSRELMIGTVVTKKDGTTTVKYVGLVTQSGTPDAQNYVYKTTLSRDADGNILKDVTQTRNNVKGANAFFWV